MKNTVLVVTDKVDAHADRLVALMRTLGHEPVRLNFSDIPLAASMSFILDSASWTGSIEVSSSRKVADLSNVTAIWWRKPAFFAFPEHFEAQEREFATEETDHALQGVWSSLDCYWISHPEDIRRAGYKMEQLQRAARMGFDVPRTAVTSDPHSAREFLEECGGSMVYKVLSDPYLAARKLIQRGSSDPVPVRSVPTTMISRTDSGRLNSVRYVPCQFQEYLPKRADVRVTLIDDQLFAVEILSQAHDETRIDWRHAGPDVQYRRAVLPDEVAERCLALMRSYRLNYGAVDLVLTPDGRYFFLELNPNGQFLFVQERVPELRLVEAMAARLIRGRD